MYSKLAEEEDNKMVDRWLKEAEGILIFVSPGAVVHTGTSKLKRCRPVYSLAPSPRYFP